MYIVRPCSFYRTVNVENAATNKKCSKLNSTSHIWIVHFATSTCCSQHHPQKMKVSDLVWSFPLGLLQNNKEYSKSNKDSAGEKTCCTEKPRPHPKVGLNRANNARACRQAREKQSCKRGKSKDRGQSFCSCSFGGCEVCRMYSSHVLHTSVIAHSRTGGKGSKSIMIKGYVLRQMYRITEERTNLFPNMLRTFPYMPVKV